MNLLDRKVGGRGVRACSYARSRTFSPSLWDVIIYFTPDSAAGSQIPVTSAWTWFYDTRCLGNHLARKTNSVSELLKLKSEKAEDFAEYIADDFPRHSVIPPSPSPLLLWFLASSLSISSMIALRLWRKERSSVSESQIGLSRTMRFWNRITHRSCFKTSPLKPLVWFIRTCGFVDLLGWGECWTAEISFSRLSIF